MAQRQAQPMGLLASTHPRSLASSEAGPQRGSGSPQGGAQMGNTSSSWSPGRPRSVGGHRAI